MLPSGVLLIDNAQYADQGVYRCVAITKKYKRVSKDAYFEVVAADGRFRPPEMLADSKLVAIEVRSGENLFLECGASGSPAPSLRWSNEPPGQAEIDLQVPTREGTNVLAIPNITVDFAGVYICRATNRDSTNKEHYSNFVSLVSKFADCGLHSLQKCHSLIFLFSLVIIMFAHSFRVKIYFNIMLIEILGVSTLKLEHSLN